MNIAELFVMLGVKGSGDSEKSIKKIDHGLGNVKSTGIATKAAIIGVVYGLERMMSNSAQAGTGLEKFARSTDLSMKTLQKWEHAGRKANVSSEDLRNSIISIQSSISAMRAGAAPPEGLVMMSKMLDDFDETKLDDTFYMLRKIQEFSQKTDAATARRLTASMGITTGLFQAIRENAFTAEKMKGAVSYSREDAKNLFDVSAAWLKIGHNFEMAMGKMVSKRGLDLAEPISEASDAVVNLTNSLVTLIDKTRGLKAITTIFEGWANAFDWIGGASDWLGEFVTSTKEIVSKQEKGAAKITPFMKKFHEEAVKSAKEKRDIKLERIKELSSMNLSGFSQQRLVLERDRLKRETGTYNTTNNVKNSVTINESNNPKKTSEQIRKVIGQTYKGKVSRLNE